MPEDPDPIEPGSQGTVVDYDGAGDLLVDWDEDVNRALHLIPGVDKFHVLDVANDAELKVSFRNLKTIQDKLMDKKTSDLDSRCPRCGKLFDVRRGAVSRRVGEKWKGLNIAVCDTCGTQEAIEDFVRYSAETDTDIEITVPKGLNKTGFESEEVENNKEKLKITTLPITDWYITKIWTGTYETYAIKSTDEVSRKAR